MLTTLFIDDDRAFSAVAAATLQREGIPVSVAHSLHEARALIAQRSFDLVVLDRRLPDGDGLNYLPELRGALPGAVVVMVTAHGDISSAVEAIRLGAADYLAKPIELSDLLFKARRAADEIRLRDRLQHAESTLSTRRGLIDPVAPSMVAVVNMLDRIAATSPRSPVLLLGETGSGKEALAWHLHQRTFGATMPFIQLNCAALPESMAESELFGHEKGAFTDARTTRRGLVELAQRGTLFLDEVGELSAALQGKLLTFLDGGRFRRLGSETELMSSARVVAATNRELERKVKEGQFREDLWFRLSVFKLEVPPLRARREDIGPLALGLLPRVARDQGRREVPRLSADALSRLSRYHFPGNVRELRNILERALVLETGPELTLDWLLIPAPGAATRAGFVSSEVETLDALERRYARWALEQLGGKRLDTAKALGISHPTFNKLVNG
ncbi:MAG: sigma-54 dependent transcriptional regulator [Archangium sp.]|nr:sigma-54 dependent transcriptional regulator [Archangium sp.]MDP3571074.1 sigma-54 dependent transcriptional regulator [Archangium sp.]